MRLVVPCIPYDGGKSGISVYIREVVAALRAEGHEVTTITEPSGRKALVSMLHHLFVLPFRIRWKDFDACILPAANRRAFCRYPIPTVAVVHDLSQYHVEAKYDAFRMFYIKRVLPFFVRKAHHVVAISNSTAADLTTHWRIPPQKISVVYNGFTAPGREGSGNSVLYISRLEHPGKNHVKLIEAYSSLPREVAAEHPLVLAGGDWNGAEEVHRAAKCSPYRDCIRLAGFVADADMPKLWSEAGCYVFPSRFEGFGLSLLEAMSAGLPCACSSTSSLGELGKGAAELFDPESVEEIAAALMRILTDANRREELIAAGRSRAASFSWRECARGLVACFDDSKVFGVPIECCSLSHAVSVVVEAGYSRGVGGAQFFAFVNAHCLNIAWSDKDYAAILKRCDAVWPDGTGVRMAGRRLGFAVPENVNGTDLFPMVCRAIEGIVRAGGKAPTVFLYGGRPGVAEKAAENVRRDSPLVEISGTCDGFVDSKEAVSRINAARPGLLFVALGVPRQEKWIAEHLGELDCGAALAVGGLLDFVSGRIPRAPMWMRRMGVEWMFRLYQEPVRLFRRYIIGNPLFLLRVRKECRSEASA